MSIKLGEMRRAGRGHDVQAMTTTDRTDKRRRKESSNTSFYHPCYVPGWPSFTDSEVKRNSVPSSRDMVVSGGVEVGLRGAKVSGGEWVGECWNTKIRRAQCGEGAPQEFYTRSRHGQGANVTFQASMAPVAGNAEQSQ